MIDNNHVVYVGVILLFLICAMIVAVAGMLVLAAGFAVATAVRIRKRRKRLKRPHPRLRSRMRKTFSPGYYWKRMPGILVRTRMAGGGAGVGQQTSLRS